MAAPTDPRIFRALVAAPSRQPPPHSRHCPAHGTTVRIVRNDDYYERRLDDLTRTAGLSIAAMEREAAEDGAAGRPRSAHQQLSLAAQLAEAREQLAEARERRRRLEGRLRDHERRVLEQKKAAEAEKRRVSSFLRVG